MRALPVLNNAFLSLIQGTGRSNLTYGSRIGRRVDRNGGRYPYIILNILGLLPDCYPWYPCSIQWWQLRIYMACWWNWFTYMSLIVIFYCIFVYHLWLIKSFFMSHKCSQTKIKTESEVLHLSSFIHLKKIFSYSVQLKYES